MKQLSVLYKRELKILLCSPWGWVFTAVNLLGLGVFTVLMSIRNGFVSYEHVLEAAALVFCVSMPTVSAFTVAAEVRRGETDMLMRYSSPVSIMLGKYLAQLTLFAVAVAVALLLPLLLLAWGSVDLLAAYIGLIGYTLNGIAIHALCMYISFAVGRTVPALITSVAVTVLLNMASNAIHTVGMRRTYPFVIVAMLIIALVTPALYFYIRNLVVSIAFLAVSSILVGIGIGVVPSIIRNLFMILSPQNSFSELSYGTFSVWGLLQPLLFTAAFLVLTVLRLSNRREIGR